MKNILWMVIGYHLISTCSWWHHIMIQSTHPIMLDPDTEIHWLTHTFTSWIFSQASATPIIPVFQYSIQLWIRLTHTFINWIFIQASATLIISVFQYSIMDEADPYIHQLNIQTRFGYSNYSCIPIFNYESGWPMHSPIEYSVKVWPLWLFLYFNYRSGWPMNSPIEYSVKVRPLWLFLYSNIQL